MSLVKKITLFCIIIFLLLATLSITFYLSAILAFLIIVTFIFFKIKGFFSKKKTSPDRHELKSFLKIFGEKYDIVAYDRENSEVIFCNNNDFLNEISHYVYTHSSVNLIKFVTENNIENLQIIHKVFAGIDVYLKSVSTSMQILNSFDNFPSPVFAISAGNVIYQNNLSKKYSKKDLLKLGREEKKLILATDQLNIYSFFDENDKSSSIALESLVFMGCLIDKKGTVIAVNSKLAEAKFLQVGDILLDKFDMVSSKKITQFIQDEEQSETFLESNLEDKNIKSLSLGIAKKEHFLIVQFFDITKNKKMEDDFLHSQKMQVVGQLAGAMAHDFNNLLTAIIGFCDLLLIRHTPGDPSFADIMQIKQNAGRSASLVKQILDVSRKQKSSITYINTEEALVGLSHLIRRLIGADIDFQFEKDRNLNYAFIDQSQFEQIIVNFIVNARDAIKTPQYEKGGQISLKAKNVDLKQGESLDINFISSKNKPIKLLPGKYISIEIKDNGTGIEKKILNKIFEPYFSTKKLGEGTGLGLFTVYNLIEKVGGYLAVQTNPGKGTCFTILLQAEEESNVIDKKRIKNNFINSDITGNETILLIEDEDPVRLFASHALENKGYHVLQASSAEEGIDIIEKYKGEIDLIITDVVMPGMDGTMLLKIIREKGCDIRVIFISGYAADTLTIDIKQERGVEFLAKPFNLKDLVVKVRNVLNDIRNQ